jgi:hypothetical protein
MEGLEATYPKVSFVWWTMPITATSNTQRQIYNDTVRSYCVTNGKWLIDIADLESHDDSRTAVSESGRESICSAYDTGDGHLNTAGQTKIAKAYWKLIGEIGKTK